MRLLRDEHAEGEHARVEIDEVHRLFAVGRAQGAVEGQKAERLAARGERYDHTAVAVRQVEDAVEDVAVSFRVVGFRVDARRAGFEPDTVWTDADNLFSVHWLRSVDDIRA